MDRLQARRPQPTHVGAHVHAHVHPPAAPHSNHSHSAGAGGGGSTASIFKRLYAEGCRDAAKRERGAARARAARVEWRCPRCGAFQVWVAPRDELDSGAGPRSLAGPPQGPQGGSYHSNSVALSAGGPGGHQLFQRLPSGGPDGGFPEPFLSVASSIATSATAHTAGAAAMGGSKMVSTAPRVCSACGYEDGVPPSQPLPAPAPLASNGHSHNHGHGHGNGHGHGRGGQRQGPTVHDHLHENRRHAEVGGWVAIHHHRGTHP